MKKVLFILCAVLLFLAACKTSNQREKLLKEIETEQQNLFGSFEFTMEKGQQLMDLYLAFADEFPQDSLTPEFLFRCADVAANSKQELYAITLYKRIYEEYLEHALRPIALLNQALAYDNMGNAASAKPLYEQFLVMFPDNPYISDVQQLLEMVDLSPEEWLLRMQEQGNEGDEE
jgi:tetratricopeptide (TPR) repeat protein